MASVQILILFNTFHYFEVRNDFERWNGKYILTVPSLSMFV